MNGVKGTSGSTQGRVFSNQASEQVQPVLLDRTMSVAKVAIEYRKPQPIPVTIIGAGPYGLSIAAHLRALGVPFRILGKAMESWSVRMPRGMLLKSEGFASSLRDPDGYTLKSFCEGRSLPYGDIGFPIPVEMMVDYGRAFQERLVPNLEEKASQRLSLYRKDFCCDSKTERVLLRPG